MISFSFFFSFLFLSLFFLSFSVSRVRFTLHSNLSYIPWYEQLRWWTTSFFFLFLIVTVLLFYTNFIFCWLSDTDFDEMGARTSYLFTKKPTITVFQHHRLLFINLSYSFLFCLLVCLFVLCYKTLSFFSPGYRHFLFFFVRIKHTYTSSDMKRQKDEQRQTVKCE